MFGFYFMRLSPYLLRQFIRFFLADLPREASLRKIGEVKPSRIIGIGFVKGFKSRPIVCFAKPSLNGPGGTR